MSIPSTISLHRLTGISRTPAEAKQSVLRLYRRSMREAPDIIRNYRLHYSVEDVQGVIRKNFQNHANVTNLHVIDTLVHLGNNELEECRQNFKTKAHILQYLEAESGSLGGYGTSAFEQGARGPEKKSAVASDALEYGREIFEKMISRDRAIGEKFE